MRRAALAAAAALALAGCGGSAPDAAAPATVFAAASLTGLVGELMPEASVNLGGSDELATQLREGAAADLFLSASARHPEELHEEGVVDEPVPFATNRLVLIVPAGEAAIAGLDDVTRPGTRLVVGGEGVPVGDYTRRTLAALGREDLLDRVVSNEKDAKGVVGKVALGEADAGFAYATDARAAGGRVRAVELPAHEGVAIVYAGAVVSASARRDEARALLRLLTGPEGRAALERAGFGLP